VKPHIPNALILRLLGSNIIGLIKGSSWSPIVSSPALKPAMDSLSVGPKGQKSLAGCCGLNVCCKWSPPYVIFSPLKRRIVSSYLFTCTTGNRPFSSSPSKPLQHYQLTMTLYLTGNHGCWYCTCGKLLGKSSMDHWTHPRHIGIRKI
jgi:hypothetical protein